ncbi:hypothetical protein ACGFY7_38965 [Streptomyces prunicolor]|uniref:hypothetical protein n=1 Tax=Streptomyces prunicolor TaxID=67348 RepID=UPI00371A277C
MSILERPEPPPDAGDLTPLEHRALALAALRHRSREIAAKLHEERLPAPRSGLGTVWAGAARKLGTSRLREQGRQPELVFRVRVHDLLDAHDPEDPGWLPPDVLGYIQALARGRTLKQYVVEDLDVPVWQVDEVAERARKLLGRPPTQACLVYRALPPLLRTVQPPVEELHMDLQRAEGPSPITISLQTELPGQQRAMKMSRWWIRGCLPALRWAGSVLDAVGVVSRLVDNGLRHGLALRAANESRIVLRVAVTESGQLVLDVTDPNPSFPGFAAAREGESGLGLRRIAELGARLTWFLHGGGSGKTVRAGPAPGTYLPMSKRTPYDERTESWQPTTTLVDRVTSRVRARAAPGTAPHRRLQRPKSAQPDVIRQGPGGEDRCFLPCRYLLGHTTARLAVGRRVHHPAPYRRTVRGRTNRDGGRPDLAHELYEEAIGIYAAISRRDEERVRRQLQEISRSPVGFSRPTSRTWDPHAVRLVRGQA